jgi:hypothetical protein
MDTGISTGTSRQEETPQSTPVAEDNSEPNNNILGWRHDRPSQNANPPQSSPITPDKDEKVVKIDDFNSFLQ